MAIRHETQRKRNAMREAILELCRSGALRNNEQIPPLRNLAREYDLSVNAALQVVHGLIAEGVLHSRHGAGTFVGSSSSTDIGIFLFLLPPEMTAGFAAASYVNSIQSGFELRVTQLGGSCLSLEFEQAQEYLKRGDLPPISGIFSINGDTAINDQFDPSIPRAWSGKPFAESKGDVVHFDDYEGGRQATRHLLSLGHRNIALLAVHTAHNPSNYQWSAERETGWRQEMQKANLSVDNLVLHPTEDIAPHEEDFLRTAREVAAALLPRLETREVTAIVAVNFYAARGLFQVLEHAQIPPHCWPAVVSFDSSTEVDNQVVSAFNLPWDELGKAGAQLLWERKTGTLKGTGQLRLVPMQLITRLTCRANGTQAASFVQHRVSASPWINSAQMREPVLTKAKR